MKSLLKVFRISVLAALFCGMMSSCEDLGHGDFSVSVKEVGADFVNLNVTAPNALEMAYQISDEPILATPAVLFKTGTVLTVEPGQVIEVNDGLEQDTHYYLYAVAKISDSAYSPVITHEFTTKKYEFKELATLVKPMADGFKVHITVPQSVKDAGNVIRYGSTSLAWYNLIKASKGGEATDVNAVVANGNPYGNYVKNDSTVVFNDMNVVLLDEDGEVIYDENGDAIDIHDPIAPGEPTIFLAGEARWGNPDEYSEIMGFYAPDKNGYYIPLYDWNKGWTGAFQKIIFKTLEPEPCEAKVNIIIPDDEIGITDAMVYFEMDPDVERYFYMILDDATYNQILSTYLDGNEDWFQWFLTSYIAFYEWGVHATTESIQTNAASSFVEPLTGGSKYHVLATAMGNEDGTLQSFSHETFVAKEKTKSSPVITVSAVHTNDPYEVTFNVKAPNKDVVGAYWACNYSREFEKMFNMKYTYADLLYGNYTFSSSEIAAMNSDEGLTLSYPTLDGETTRLAVYGCNDEYTFNKIDPATEGAGWADNTAPMCEPDAPINSPLFEALADDWTATATIVAKEKVSEDSDETISYNVEYKSKVTISNTAPEIPSSLSAKDYELYKNMDRAEVDGMYEELLSLNEAFTDYRLVGQNRMLCNGFIDFDYYEDNGRLKYMNPYDLFVAKNYSSVDVPQIIYDFGPKWFLEVLEDGRVIVPLSTAYLPPMHAWPGYTYYSAAVASGYAIMDGSEEVPGFPVEISEDMNTITIKPIMVADENGKQIPAYMNSVALVDGSYEIVATIVSEIVLTRGWKETAKKNSVEAMPAKAMAVTMDGAPAELPAARSYKSMTELSAPARKDFKVVEKPTVVTKEMVDKASDKILKHFNLK